MISLLCKRLGALSAVILALMITAGCTSEVKLQDKEVSIYQKIHRKFSRMTAYTATVRITVTGNQTEQTYEMRQSVKEPGMARLELTEPSALAGLVTVINGKQLTLWPSAEAAPFAAAAADEPNSMLLNSFFAEYYASEDTALSVSGGGAEPQTMLLETAVQPSNSRSYKMTLLLDVKKLEPKALAVYDIGGNIRMKAEFLDFCYNPVLADSLFVT